MERFAKAIQQKNVAALLERLLESRDGIPVLKMGFGRETELWDFKRGLPTLKAEHEVIWADIAADIAAFHNKKGGLLVFGIDDKTLSFVGTRDPLDAKRFNDKIRRYLGDTIWVEFSREYIQSDKYLGVALIPPRELMPLRMRCDAPVQKTGERSFSKGDLPIRERDSTRIYRGSAADEYLAKNRLPSPDSRFLINDARARILRPDWSEFITRDELCTRVVAGINDGRTYVTTLTGIGGIGKTALACWGVLEAYKESRFEFIISVSAKDRELSEKGIKPIEATLTSYDDLLNEILDVLGFSEYKSESTESREGTVRALLDGASVLLFVDNLETVDDGRVVTFLETLPKPTKAITTSRTNAVRTAAFPITVGPLSDQEAVKFFDRYALVIGRPTLRNAAPAEKLRIVRACSAVPLAVQWLIGHSADVASALRLADAISTSGARDEELLEFCFRRVHVGLTEAARYVLAALTLTDKPQPIEALVLCYINSLPYGR
ncbi:MAG TPA: RNA-binding domain-containing protein [Thermoanaerobaculia bacterium]|jgi:hypothetical protein|nr:RNA-binding domain-containing protein [Thermoanaerobaculia bacterium]